MRNRALLCAYCIMIASASAAHQSASIAQGAQKNQAEAAKGEASQPEAPAAADETTPETPPSNPVHVPPGDPELRPFGGRACVHEPVGRAEQAGLLGIVLPQLVGAGIDMLTNALASAGEDRLVSRSVVFAFERPARCVQIARGLSIRSRGASPEALENQFHAAPFFVEFYLRQSSDGSALLIMPTRLNYRETLDRRRTSRARELYATITIVSGSTTSSATIPLGSRVTREAAYFFDPAGLPLNEDISPLGAASSAWMPNPFRGQQPEVPAPPQQAATNEGASPGTAEETQPQTMAPVPIPAPLNQGGNAQSAAAADARTAGARGNTFAPFSMTVVLHERRPGSALARALAGVLRGSRDGIVGLVNPTQQAAAETQARTTATGIINAYMTARNNYVSAVTAFCAPDANKRALAPNVYAAQLALYQAAADARSHLPPHEILPFTSFIVPESGAGYLCPT